MCWEAAKALEEIERLKEEIKELRLIILNQGTKSPKHMS